MKTLGDLKKELKKTIPSELVEKLFEYYEIIKNNFRLKRHENTEINASKYSETMLRVLQNFFNSSYTALDKQIHQFTKKCQDFELLPASGVDDSLRIHIPRTLILIMDIRNKRGVGHVSGIHNPNLLDATLVTTCADWVMAEIIRIFAKLSSDESQQIIDKIIETEVPIVEKIGEITRVLDTKLKYPKSTIVLLYSHYPIAISDKILFEWTEHSKFSAYKDVLKKLHKDKLIEYSTNGFCHLLKPGIIEAEKILSN